MIRSLKNIYKALVAIDRDENFSLLGVKHPVVVCGVCTCVLVGLGVALAIHRQGLTRQTRNGFPETIGVIQHIDAIQNELNQQTQVVAAMNADVKAILATFKLGIEPHFEIPLTFKPRFGSPTKTDSSQSVADTTTCKPKKTTKARKQTNRRSAKTTRQRRDCPDVKVIILRDTCGCGDFIINTLNVQ